MTECKNNCKNGKIYMEYFKKFVPCPECGGIKKALEKPDETGLSLLARLRIPTTYSNLEPVDSELFVTNLVNKFSADSINNVSNLLFTINANLYASKLTLLSCYINVPPVIDIRRFVYGAQRLALEKGLTVTPYIALDTLRGIKNVGNYEVRDLKEVNLLDLDKKTPLAIINAVDGLRFVSATGLTYYDFCNSDVCFLRASAQTSEKDWVILADLLDARANNSLPTYIMGYWDSMGINGYSGLNYLTTYTGNSRLDLLSVYELKKKGTTTTVPLGGVTLLSGAKSDVNAGLSVSQFID